VPNFRSVPFPELFEASIAFQADIFCLSDFFSAPVSGIQQPAYRSDQDKDQDNGMKLERQEKEKGSSDQDKNGDQSDPKRIVVRKIPLSLRYIFRSTERTSHCSMILIRSIREIEKKTKDFSEKKRDTPLKK
jgi:hypothetical protein